MVSLLRLEPGAQLGRYELLAPIAQGGMATVWAARLSGSHGFSKTVAIKTILPELSDDVQFQRMFSSEARLAMRVQHPNVAQTLDLGEQDGLVYLVMEWIDGESLSTLLKSIPDRKLPLRLGAHLCLQAARGLHAAHEVSDDDDRPAGIIHRDVSPQNVMVTYDGHVKIVDFGIAKAQTDGASTMGGQFKGKILYTAPEQAAGRPVDRRTDVFALGILLHRATVGEHPFGGDTPAATLQAILSRNPTAPESRDPAYPPLLGDIVRRCLAKKPDDRFQTMADVADKLEFLLGRLGPPVSESELSTVMKRQLGDLRRQRRETLRTAAKRAGWAIATDDSLPAARLSGPGLHVSLTPSVTSLEGTGSAVAGPEAPSWRARGKLALIAASLLAATLGGIFFVRAILPKGDATDAAVGSSSGAPTAARAPSSPEPTLRPSADTGMRTAPPAAITRAQGTEDPAAGGGRSTASPEPPPPPIPRPMRPPPVAPPRKPGSAATAKPHGWDSGPDMGF